MTNLVYKKGILKKLSKFPKKDRLFIEDFLDNLALCNKPIALPNCKKLLGYASYYRYRVGNYRIVCDISENGDITIFIIDIDHRKDIYRKM